MQKKITDRLVNRKCRKKNYWRLAILLLLALATSIAWVTNNTSNQLTRLVLELRKDFPEVNHLSIEDFLATDDGAILVDVRTAEEFQISRIPGAIHIDDRNKLLAFATEHANESIVLYCSVGLRSSEAARFLRNHGFEKVANLEGSIFKWINEERPLVNDQGPTKIVHPYNSYWGWRYLSPGVQKNDDTSHSDGNGKKATEMSL